MVRSFLVKAFAAAAMVALSSTAYAATIIDFKDGSATAGGSITWNGTDLYGVGVPIGVVSILGAPLGSANRSFNVDGTIAQTPDDVNDGSHGSLDFNTATNSVTITGCIPGLGIGTGGGGCTPVTLLSGTVSYSNVENGQAGANTRIEFGAFDVASPEIAAAIGLPANTPFVVDTFALLTGSLTPNGNSVMSTSTDVQETAVPEPATMMLLGTGLLAAFRARRRQQA